MFNTIFYKFKSERDFDTIHFDGSSISAKDLRRNIAQKRHLYDNNRFNNFDIVVVDTNTGLEFSDDAQIQRNTFILVKRQPTNKDMKSFYIKKHSEEINVNDNNKISQNVQGMSEDEKIKALSEVNFQDWIPEHVKVPPLNYVCHRCGIAGHFIQDCPTNGDRSFDGNRFKSKKMSGIPKSMLQSVNKELDVGENAHENKPNLANLSNLLFDRLPHARKTSRRTAYHPYRTRPFERKMASN